MSKAKSGKGKTKSAADTLLAAGGLVNLKSKCDKAAAERVVARRYSHPALGERPVIRLASDRLGQAEDLAMEFLGFESPKVSKPIGLQQRRSLGFAAWALINDPDNAQFALDLVKKMKSAARKARSKPGHAWDQYAALADDLGAKAPHFLPAFWEDAGRAYKDLGNQTYAGRSLSRSLQAERVHALEADRARRRDVVLEFVLAGCLAGKALSDYSKDLQQQYKPVEAFEIFRDLCERRTRGGMAPWAAMPKDFLRIAKAAELDADAELEKWLDEVIDTPAMSRPAIQFWKSCSKHCKRIVDRDPDFAISLLQINRCGDGYGDGNIWAWLDLLEGWGALDYIWEDEHNGSKPLGEPIAEWFGNIIHQETPAPLRVMEMLEGLAPRLKKEKQPIPLFGSSRWHAETDIDVLEACFQLGLAVDDPPENSSVKFAGWLAAEPDHAFRNQDVELCIKDERFTEQIESGFATALRCKGGEHSLGWNQPSLEQRSFPLAAGDKPGIRKLWEQHSAKTVDDIQGLALEGFRKAQGEIKEAFWPETLQHFPETAERLSKTDAILVLQKTLQGGVFDEYGWPHFEQMVEEHQLKVIYARWGSQNTHLHFPHISVVSGGYVFVAKSDGTVAKYEAKLPKKCEINDVVAFENDALVSYYDPAASARKQFWANHSDEKFGLEGYHSFGVGTHFPDGSAFFGKAKVAPGDKKLHVSDGSEKYFHDGERFWDVRFDYAKKEDPWTISEIDPETGKKGRKSVPPWFEEDEGGVVDFNNSALLTAPKGAEESPLGCRDGKLGLKSIRRKDNSTVSVRIDAKRWERTLGAKGSGVMPVALLNLIGTDQMIPITSGYGEFDLWDLDGESVATNIDFQSESKTESQVTILPLEFWHLLKPRHVESSKRLRGVDHATCQKLFDAAEKDLGEWARKPKSRKDKNAPTARAAVNAMMPDAPELMQIGVTKVVMQVTEAIGNFNELREKLANADDSPSSEISLGLIDDGAKHWGLPSFNLGWRSDYSVAQHLLDAAKFLRGEAKAGSITPSDAHWYPMLELTTADCWGAYWNSVSSRNQQGSQKLANSWVDFLAFWQHLDLAAMPGSFAVLRCEKIDWKKVTQFEKHGDDGASFTMTNGDDRFVGIFQNDYRDKAVTFVRYSTAAKPGHPPGFKIAVERELKKSTGEGVAEFVEAAVEKGSDEPPIPSKEELIAAAESIGVSPGEVGLVWMAGAFTNRYDHNFLPKDIRTRMGLKVAGAGAARQSLQSMDKNIRKGLFAAVINAGPTAPFEDDLGPCLTALETAWGKVAEKRVPLDPAIQKRLLDRRSYSRWGRSGGKLLMAAAADPDAHPALKPVKTDIAPKKNDYGRHLGYVTSPASEEPTSMGLVRGALQMMAMVAAETQLGHPARSFMEPLHKQLIALCESETTLVELVQGHTAYESDDKAVDWLEQVAGKTTPGKKKTHRFQDELLLAVADNERAFLVGYYPAALRDRHSRERLRAICESDEASWDPFPQQVTPVDMLRSRGVIDLCKSIAKARQGAAEELWPQNPLHTAPEVVAAIGETYGLEEHEAQLYLQLLALPEPTTANLKIWNGWTAAKVKKAAEPLKKQKLVLEAKRARAGRAYFLPGKWETLKSPWLPIEAWKVSLYVDADVDFQTEYPLGGPLIFRPISGLFAAAWQRVVDGDEPGYEEIQRKGKSKKAASKAPAKKKAAAKKTAAKKTTTKKPTRLKATRTKKSHSAKKVVSKKVVTKKPAKKKPAKKKAAAKKKSKAKKVTKKATKKATKKKSVKKKTAAKKKTARKKPQRKKSKKK